MKRRSGQLRSASSPAMRWLMPGVGSFASASVTTARASASVELEVRVLRELVAQRLWSLARACFAQMGGEGGGGQALEADGVAEHVRLRLVVEAWPEVGEGALWSGDGEAAEG